MPPTFALLVASILTSAQGLPRDVSKAQCQGDVELDCGVVDAVK